MKHDFTTEALSLPALTNLSSYRPNFRMQLGSDVESLGWNIFALHKNILHQNGELISRNLKHFNTSTKHNTPHQPPEQSNLPHSPNLYTHRGPGQDIERTNPFVKDPPLIDPFGHRSCFTVGQSGGGDCYQAQNSDPHNVQRRVLYGS